MEVRLQDSNLHVKTECFACGTTFRLASVAAVVYDGSAQSLGVICESCIAAGPEAVCDLIRAQAADLRAAARELEALAAGPLTMPTLSEWQERLEKADEGPPAEDGDPAAFEDKAAEDLFGQ